LDNQKITVDALITLVSMMKGDQKWTENHDWAYQLGLDGIPLEAVPIMCREVQRKFNWRPSVKELWDWSKDLTSPRDLLGSTEALALVVGLVHRFGANGANHPQFPGASLIRAPGPPPELANAPVAVLSAIEAMGGWVAMCEEDVPPGVWRAQFERLYKASILDEGMDRTRELQREYREQKRQIESERAVDSFEMGAYDDIKHISEE
jgi:hypothetical protein